MDATVIWDEEPGQNVDHVADNGLTPDEVDEVLLLTRSRLLTATAQGDRASLVTLPPAST